MGYLDPDGLYVYEEDDLVAPGGKFSDLLNIGLRSIRNFAPGSVKPSDIANLVVKGTLALLGQDHGMVAGSQPDNTAALQALVNLAAKGNGVVVLKPGTYKIGSVTIPAGVTIQALGSYGADFSIGVGNGLENTVNLVHLANATGPMLRIVGGGVTLEGLNLRGNDYAANGYPLMHILDGFELRMRHVRMLSKKGNVLLIDRMNNTAWFDVKIADCESVNGSACVVVRGPTEAGYNAGENNTLDFDGLTIERYRNGPALDIAFGPTGNYWAEFVRINKLHIESPNGYWNPSVVGPDDGLVRIGNIMGCELVSPIIYVGGAIPAVLFKRSFIRAGSPMGDGLRFIGGHILGANGDKAPNVTTPVLVELAEGDDVSFQGTRFGRYTYAAVRIRPTFGSRVVLDAACSFMVTTAAQFVDERAVGNASTWRHPGSLDVYKDVRVRGHMKLASTLGVGTVTAGGNLGAGGAASVIGDDKGGTIYLTVGAGGSTGWTLAEILFKVPGVREPNVVMSPLNDTAGGFVFYAVPATGKTLDGFTIRCKATLPAGNYKVAYWVTE